MSHSNNKPPYPHAAGGWGALKSSAKHIIQTEQAAKGVKTLLRANQPGGFDCPGCAWGDQTSDTKVDFCENGVKAIAWEATAKRTDSEFFAQHSVSELTQWDDHALEKNGRLSHPMVYNKATDHYQEITWTDAFSLIGSELNKLADPNQALFYTSGRASNEVAYLYQLFGRAYGTNNFPDCSNMCHEASGVAVKRSLGTGKGTVTMTDFEQADAIFIFGQNPATNHPRMLGTLRKASKRGARIVAINTLKERGLQKFTDPQSSKEMLLFSSTDISHHYFTPRLGGDMALVRGIAKFLFEWAEQDPEIIDQPFINQHCHGFSQYKQAVIATSWQQILQQSALTKQEIETMARLYARSERAIFTWAMGITQHRHSVATIEELVNVLLLRGNIGKAGAGACPVRGHSNVQGNRTVGINEKPPQQLLNALAQRYQFNVPQAPGLNTVGAIHAMLEQRAKVFIGLGGNFARATPDTELTCRALAQCNLTVHISTKLNRSHLITGQQALILPCLGRTEIDRQASGEQMISVEDSMSMVHSSRGLNEPASPDLKSETAIIAAIAQATLERSDINWDKFASDYSLIRNEITQVIPGFEDFNQRLIQDRGFYLGNSAASRQWHTATNKANFAATSLPEELIHQSAQRLTDKPILTLQTMRSHDQYNTTVYGMDDRYRGVYGERQVIFLNSQDMQAQQLKENDLVTIESISDDNVLRKVEHFKVKQYQIPRGCAAAYYPETNPLVPLNSAGDDSDTPTYKSIAITLSRQ